MIGGRCKIGWATAGILRLMRGNSFDPEAISILSEALEDAWLKIEASGSGLARPAYARLCAKCWPNTSSRKLSVVNLIGPNSVQALSGS